MRKMLIPRDVIVLTPVTVDILGHVERIYDLIFPRPTNKGRIEIKQGGVITVDEAEHL